jgi:D-2-hydroxyglutarate dehydrogenase|tara:strand:+ start:2788 stop:3813 length:1026 start_codon:yes stop_codon:yes gene_type:complete
LKQLFIGGEGSLGVVTKVAIHAPPAALVANVAFIGVCSFSAAVGAMRLAKQVLGSNLSAFEFLDRTSLTLVLAQLKGTKDPLPSNKSPFYVVVEVTEAGDSAGDGSAVSQTKIKNAALKKSKRRLANFCESLRKKNLATGFVVGKDSKHAFVLWNLRERISLALKHAGAVYKYDLSVSADRMYEIVDLLRAKLASAVTNGIGGPSFGTGVGTSGANRTNSRSSFDFSQVSVMGYGHLGDGNLHLNVSSPAGYDPGLLALIEPFVYVWTSENKGSVSAEHGIGVQKRDELGYSKPQLAIELMKSLKNLFDPNGILNPYKALPRDTQLPRRDEKEPNAPRAKL